MKRTFIWCFLVCSLWTVSANACVYPSLPRVPPQDQLRGREAETVQAMQTYIDAMQGYLDCLRAELDAGGEDASDTFKALLVRRNNTAVAEAEAVRTWIMSLFEDVSPAPAN